MNKYLITVVMAVMMGAGYSQRSEALPTCAMDLYSNYLGTSCTDLSTSVIFSNFSYVNTPSGGAPPVLSSGVTVIPTSFPLGLTFVISPPLSASSGTGNSETNDITIDYTVTCITPFNCINGAELDMVGGVTGAATGTGFEVICLNATTIVACPVANIRFLNIALSGPLSATTTFPPMHGLSLVEDIVVSDAGTATISRVVNQFSQVPEPATLALLGSGLFSLAALGRRKTSR